MVKVTSMTVLIMCPSTVLAAITRSHSHYQCYQAHQRRRIHHTRIGCLVKINLPVRVGQCRRHNMLKTGMLIWSSSLKRKDSFAEPLKNIQDCYSRLYEGEFPLKSLATPDLAPVNEGRRNCAYKASIFGLQL